MGETVGQLSHDNKEHHSGRHTAAHGIIASRIDSLKQRRSARAAERQFRQELATFSSPSQINDMLAMFATRDDAQARDMRDILARNLQHQV